MPELPEVETVARQLNQVLPGKVIEAIKVLRVKSGHGELGGVVGKVIARVWRRGKMVVIEVSGEYVIIHLKMTGQLIYQQKGLRDDPRDAFVNPAGRIVGGHPSPDWIQTLPSQHTRIVIQFTDGSMLFFNDLRVFGWMKCLSAEEYRQFEVALPPDATDKTFTVEYFTKILRSSRRPVKLVIMDSGLLGGVGNIYANDALFLARIDPRRVAKELSDEEVARLYQSIRTVINRGIEYGGASERDYVHVDGLGGHYQEHFLVYKQQGKPCQNGCGTLVRKIQLGGRGTYFCPECQK